MLNDWSHKVRAILKKYCPGNIKKILPSSQSAWNTRFYFGHQKLCMDNNTLIFARLKSLTNMLKLLLRTRYLALPIVYMKRMERLIKEA